MNRRRTYRWRRMAAFGAVAALAVTTGSCDLEEILQDLGLSSGPEDLTGQNAFVHLQVDSSRGSTTDMQAVMDVIEWQAEGGQSVESADTFGSSPEFLGTLQATNRQRGNLRAENFDLYNFFDFAPEDAGDNKAIFNPPDLNSLQDEFLIRNLDAIPVRNQGGRGTCAAFTGIGHIEYAVLEATGLSTIDLSEQRFYYNSKPECQQGGCTSSDAGSWYGTGMDASVAASTFDIPLETDCPYNSNQLSDEVQHPQPASCENGAVRIESYEVVYQPSEIIRILEQRNLPVPFASPLSDNWYYNNGLITLAEAGQGGADMHAAGHAYLIVGYRKLPNMPEEGGMCFVIKNSWGTGWGVNGYSCMTLAWMEEWNYGYALDQPVVVNMAVRDDIGTVDNNDDDQPDWADEDVNDDETIDYDDLDNDDPIPEPDPPPSLDWVSSGLIGPDDRIYEAEYAISGSDIYIRGVIRGEGFYSGDLQLDYDGGTIIFDGDVVGQIEDNDVRLCTGQFDGLCSLRINRDTNALYVEFLYPEFRPVRDSELPSGGWQQLVSIPGGSSLEFYQPEGIADALLSPLFVRVGNNVTGEAQSVRLSIGSNFNIRAMGQDVGSINPSNFGLCTGGWSDNCSMFRSETNLVVLPYWGQDQ